MIKVGPVYDQWQPGNWGVIGGANVHCAHTHSYISVRVREVFSPYENGPFSFIGLSNYWSASNTWGFYDPNILMTSRICGHAGYWYTQADVSIGGIGSFIRTSTKNYVGTPC